MVEYLELFKGDDTDFSLNQAICIKLVTDYDLAGCTAHVKFYDYEQTFYPIVDKKLPLSFPGSVTSKFPLGRGSAKIWLTEPDPEGSGTRRRTVANDLKILVTNNIDLLSRKDISYTMLLRYDYKDLDSKPMLNGKVIEGDHTDDYYGIKGPKPDTELSEESENAVQNKVIAVKFKEKANLAALAPKYSATFAYSVGAIVYHDGNIYQCTTAIADGGEPWNAEHWELRKLDDFFTEATSYTGDLPTPTGKLKNTKLDQAVQIVLGETGGEDEKTQTVFRAFAKMDGFTDKSVESDSFDIAITKLSQLLGEDITA